MLPACFVGLFFTLIAYYKKKQAKSKDHNDITCNELQEIERVYEEIIISKDDWKSVNVKMDENAAYGQTL